ncbi:hypothetical protein [Bacillus sp. X1(2014)]|uniref:hypothetical protein n=1 Tax=Bacillus sp. X1(2014) TaxID=1565991 RepID=UPI0011A917C8|nr:hypothetical protein [Bacillus sp. X1(2014)]
MVYLKDPVSIKEALSVALEVLPDNKYNQLKESVAWIPIIVGRTKWEIPEELKEDLIHCIKEFKQSKTYFWLREDFKNALYDMEIQLDRKIS